MPNASVWLEGVQSRGLFLQPSDVIILLHAYSGRPAPGTPMEIEKIRKVLIEASDREHVPGNLLEVISNEYHFSQVN